MTDSPTTTEPEVTLPTRNTVTTLFGLMLLWISTFFLSGLVFTLFNFGFGTLQEKAMMRFFATGGVAYYAGASIIALVLFAVTRAQARRLGLRNRVIDTGLVIAIIAVAIIPFYMGFSGLANEG